MAMSYQKSKFKFSETFNNSDGKTSGSGFVGVILGLIAGLCFISGSIAFFYGYENVMEYLNKVIQLGGLVTVLMGIRKAVDSKKKKEEENEKPIKQTDEPKNEQLEI